MTLAQVGDWTGLSGGTGSNSVSHPYFVRKLKRPLLSASFRPYADRASRGSSPAAKRGLRFEAKVLRGLEKTYGVKHFIPHLTFVFEEEMGADCRPGQRGTAIPDGLLFSSDFRQVLLLEIKLRHSGDAWYQTNRFYRPIVQKAFGNLVEVIPVEIVHLYDPRVKLPVPQAPLRRLDEAFGLRPHFHPVLILDKEGRGI